MKNVLAIAALAASLVAIGVVTLRPRPKTETADPAAPSDNVAELLEAGQPIRPLPSSVVLDPRRVELGRTLFHDVRLSKDDTISCATCHNLERGGVDGLRVSTGVDGAQGSVNAPTVLNSSLNFKQFWDGRAATLEEQIDEPITHPSEMGSTWAEVIEKLRSDTAWAREFNAAYPEGLTATNIKNAIATFERSLITPDSRFDRYLRGHEDALRPDEKRGYELFLEVGCATCHHGENVGGNSFQTFGIASNYFEDRGRVTKSDLGRFNVTGRERDRYKFKVPTLRNISKTAPYLHDGSVTTLEEVVQIMARYQLGHDLDDTECRLIVAFLRSLDGEYSR